jgi:hypothetical protein
MRIKRFPKDFMFQLTKEEWEDLRLNIIPQAMSSQIVTTYPDKRPLKALPYTFTEQGVAMLSGILNSDRAIKMNIAIMRAFVEVRKVLLQQTDIKKQLKLIQQRITEHDVQLSQIYDSIKNLLDEKAAQRKWEDRERIGLNNHPPCSFTSPTPLSAALSPACHCHREWYKKVAFPPHSWYREGCPGRGKWFDAPARSL